MRAGRKQSHASRQRVSLADISQLRKVFVKRPRGIPNFRRAVWPPSWSLIRRRSIPLYDLCMPPSVHLEPRLTTDHPEARYRRDHDPPMIRSSITAGICSDSWQGGMTAAAAARVPGILPPGLAKSPVDTIATDPTACATDVTAPGSAMTPKPRHACLQETLLAPHTCAKSASRYTAATHACLALSPPFSMPRRRQARTARCG